MLYLDIRSVERTPYAPDVLVDTGDWLARHPLVLLRTRIPQQFNFFPHTFRCQIFNVDRLLVAVEVIRRDYWVIVVLAIDLDFDLRVALREGTKLIFEV